MPISPTYHHVLMFSMGLITGDFENRAHFANYSLYDVRQTLQKQENWRPKSPTTGDFFPMLVWYLGVKVIHFTAILSYNWDIQIPLPTFASVSINERSADLGLSADEVTICELIDHRLLDDIKWTAVIQYYFRICEHHKRSIFYPTRQCVNDTIQ